MAQIKKTPSLFMILLVMLIPVCASDAYAASVDITGISGTDGVDNYIRSNDIITINALASLGASEDVTPEKLRVYVDSSTAYATFNAGGCQSTAEGSSEFNCTYTSNVFGVAGSHTYAVKLFRDSTKNIPGASPEAFDTADVAVDNVGAKVISVQASPNRTHGGNIQVSYVVEDYAETEGDTSFCSGVDTVEFYLDDLTGSLLHIEDTYNLCTVSGSFTYDAGTAEGDFRVCAKAYDRLGQSIITSACGDYHVDRAGPQADISSVVVVEHGTPDTPIEYVGGTTGARADISVIIDADDLDPGSVRADFSALGAGSNVAPAGAPVFDGASMYIFTWEDVQISPSPSSSAFDVYAEDEIGNPATTTVPTGISIDDQGPAAQQILTTFINPNDGLYYFGSDKTNITATLTEPGIGLDETEVYMHLDDIGGGTRVEADNCTKYSGDTWYCTWENIEPGAPIGDGIYTLSISGESKDRLGNIMGSEYQQQMGVDRTGPQIFDFVEMDLQGGVNYDAAAPGVIFTGDHLEFRVCTDDIYSARADFSALGEGDDVLPEDCDTSTDPPCCTFEVEVSESGPYEADIEFTFVDDSGNMATLTRSINVSGFYDDAEPDLWDVESLACSPDWIDREIASLTPYPMYCYISLDVSPYHAAALPLSFSMEDFPVDCTANNPDLAIQDYIQDIQVMNNVPGSTSPFLFITLQQTNFLLDHFKFTCQFEIYSKETIGSDDYYTLNPEPENVTVNIKFYDLPVGTLGNTYTAALAEVADELEWMEGWFDEVYEIYEALKGTCDTIVAVNTVLTGVTALGALLGLSADVTKGNKAGTTGYWTALDTAWKSTCQTKRTTGDGVLDLKIGWLDDICTWVNCEYTEGKDGKKNPTWYGVQNTGWWGTYMEDHGGFAGGDEGAPTRFGGTNLSDYGQEFDVKDSIVWSLATLCVPGILYNMNKLREIDCQWGVCLLAMVPQGLPKDACDGIYNYMTCKFWWGELFNALPWTNAFSNTMQQYQQLLSDPATAVGELLTLIMDCPNFCTTTAAPESTMHRLCMVKNTIKMIDDAWSEVEKIMDSDYFETGNIFCEQYYALLGAG